MPKSGPGWKTNCLRAVHLLQDRVAGDVAGEQVGGELDALCLEAQGLGEAFDQLRLAEAGEALEQEMTPRQQAGDDVVDQLLLAEEDGIERGAQPGEAGAGGGDFGFVGVLGGHGGIGPMGRMGPI